MDFIKILAFLIFVIVPFVNIGFAIDANVNPAKPEPYDPNKPKGSIPPRFVLLIANVIVMFLTMFVLFNVYDVSEKVGGIVFVWIVSQMLGSVSKQLWLNIVAGIAHLFFISYGVYNFRK